MHIGRGAGWLHAHTLLVDLAVVEDVEAVEGSRENMMNETGRNAVRHAVRRAARDGCVGLAVIGGSARAACAHESNARAAQRALSRSTASKALLTQQATIQP